MQKASDLARFFYPVNILWEKLRNEFKYFKIEKETPDGFKMCFIHRLYFNNLGSMENRVGLSINQADR